MSTKQFVVWLTLVTPLTLAACGGAADARPPEQAAEPVIGAATSAAQPTGTIIEVKMITDDKGNYFEPSTIEAKPGDVIRLVLVSGVHNFSMPADRNAAGLTLPPPSDLLQLPGQTFDVPVDLAPGEYYFQCDPHALLGMTGTLKVTE
jgi:plastocyanin